MTGKMTGKCISAGLVCCLSVGILTGCSDKKIIDYGMEENTENIQTEEEKKQEKSGSYGTLEQFSGASGWEGEEAYPTAITEKGTAVNFNMDRVQIVLPEAEEMFVVEVEESEFDAAYKKRIIKNIFPAGDIYYYDTRHATKKDLLERRERWQAEYNSYGEEDVQEKDTLSKEIQSCDEALKTAGDNYIPAEDFGVNQYLGERDGVLYELSFYSDNSNELGCREKGISLMPKDIYQVSPEEVSGVEGLYYDVVEFEAKVENQCTISEEEAKGYARSFADELGLEYPVYSGVNPLAWWNGNTFGSMGANYIANGYVFTFDIGVDNISFVMAGIQENYGNMRMKKESEKPQYSMKARLEIYVTEKGVIGMQAYNPVEITGMSDGVKLLPIETVKDIIREEIIENTELFRFCLPDNVTVTSGGNSLYIEYDEMELLYFRVRDKENVGIYSYVPAWRLSEHSAWGNAWNGRRFDNPIIINAIDGSVINFYEEA